MSDSVTPWTVARQAPLSMGFPRQEYWSGLPFPSPRHLLNPRIEPRSPALQADSLPLSHQGSPIRAVGPLLNQLGMGEGDWKAAFFMFCIHISFFLPQIINKMTLELKNGQKPTGSGSECDEDMWNVPFKVEKYREGDRSRVAQEELGKDRRQKIRGSAVQFSHSVM